MKRNIVQMKRLIKTYTTQQILIVGVLVAVALGTSAQEQKTLPDRSTPRFISKPAIGLNVDEIKTDLQTNGFSRMSQLPLWVYSVNSPRDNNQYSGVVVGANPFSHGGQKNINIRGYVIPLIIVTNSIAKSIDFNTGQISMVPGATILDPTQPTACLTAPNNIPSKLLAESPLFNRTDFNFGGTDVGRTQYIDAFQRGNFWSALGDNNIRQDYHVILNPVQFLDPIVINVPELNGVAFTDPLIFGPPPICPPLGDIDIEWLDAYLQSTILPKLATQGVGSSDLPMFLISSMMYFAPFNAIGPSFITGYHTATSTIPVQTYLVTDFDSTQYYLLPFDLGLEDTGTLSHELAEWMNDPLTTNQTPGWGLKQVPGYCQNNLEVGDPLSGTGFPAVKMSNGFTYHLQELAFFSWFFGGDSLGINGWYSNNGTFLTDAGSACQ